MTRKKKWGHDWQGGWGAEWCYEVEIFHNIEVFPIANFPGGGRRRIGGGGGYNYSLTVVKDQITYCLFLLI